MGAIRIADWRATRLRDTSTGPVNHAEPATPCGNVVDRATPSPLSERCPRVALTGAGVSAGIDLALTLAAKIAGPEVAQSIQLAIEYDPQPPFDAGSPSKAPKAIYAMAASALGDR
jgi:hypothetical protein